MDIKLIVSSFRTNNYKLSLMELNPFENAGVWKLLKRICNHSVSHWPIEIYLLSYKNYLTLCLFNFVTFSGWHKLQSVHENYVTKPFNHTNNV